MGLRGSSLYGFFSKKCARIDLFVSWKLQNYETYYKTASQYDQQYDRNKLFYAFDESVRSLA